MRSAARKVSNRSSVTSPMIRIPRPGPGNGCRFTISSGKPSSRPTARTSSLNSNRNGSTSWNSRSSGNPPTLWWLLMFAVPAPPPDSTTSGYNVPCTKNSTAPTVSAGSSANTKPTARSNDRMNSLPIAFRFASGSVTPASLDKKASRSSTVTSFAPVAFTKSVCTCSRSPARNRPWSTKTQVSRSPMARCTKAAATAESTPPDNPQIARPVSPTCSRTVSINSSAIFAGVQFCSNPAISVRKRTRISWPWGECSTSGWYCTPAIRRAAHSNAATGAPAEEAVTVKPSGAADTASP